MLLDKWGHHICTADDPWTTDKLQRAIHPDAYEDGEQRSGWPGGHLVDYKCPNCGHRWEEELPQ